jgi:class 3 adenylate cyclase/tetratricopeptide (TPR) repeat protein
VNEPRAVVADRPETAYAESPALLRKERKHVTVLFADISGSTDLIDGVDPEQAVETLDPALNAMREAIRHYGGTVNEVRGDGVMALFGAPIAQEDHALRACHAALALQKSIAEIPGRPIRVRIGLNSGAVVVRAILNDLGVGYTAVGPAVHLAGRMEQQATPGRILISERTQRLVSGFVSTSSLGPFEIRGVAEPVEIFELNGSLEDRSRWEARAVGGLSDFVGREDELALLEVTLGYAAAGYRRLAAVSGPAGVGKSRLVHEFTRRASINGWSVLEASGSPLTQAATHYPIRRMLAAWLEIDETDDAGKRAARVSEGLEALGPEVSDAIPALEAVFDLPVSDPAWEKLDPIRRRERIMGGVAGLIDALADLSPLILVFEDLQWMDVETCSVVQRVVAGKRDPGVLIVTTFRDHSQFPWATDEAHSAIELDGLDGEESEALLRSELGAHPALGGMIDLLIQTTSGVPLFLEETLRDLIETGALRGRSGDYRPAVALHELEIPESIEGVVEARLDRLAAPLKKLLQQASILGREIPVEVAVTAFGLEPSQARVDLEALCGQDFLRATESPDGDRYSFKHALIQEAAYGSLLRSERRQLHLQVLGALEQRSADRGDEAVEEMGLHAYRGASWSKAATYLQRAGLKAVSRSAHREALSSFEGALGAVEALPRSEESTRSAIRLRLLIRGCLVPLGDAEQIERHLSEAEAAAAEMGDTRWLGLVYANATYSDWLAGRHAAGVESGLRALAIARDLDDLTVRVTACFGLGLAYHGMGRFREAVEVHGELLEQLPPGLDRKRFNGPAYPSVLARGFLAYAHAELGELETASSHADSAIRLAQELEDSFGLVLSRIAAGQTWLRLQDPERAIAILEPGIEECRTAKMPTVAVGVMAHLGVAYAAVGEPAKAIDVLERVVDVADDEEIPAQNLDRWHLALAWAHLVRGAVGEAARVADLACERACLHGDEGTHGWALLLSGLARARTRAGGPGPGEFFDQAISIARSHALVPLEAHALLEMARWKSENDETAAASASARSAARQFRALGLDGPMRDAEALGGV